MSRWRRVWGALLAGVWLAAAGCGDRSGAAGSGARRIVVVMEERSASDYRFDPARIEVAPGERIEFVLRNRGRLEHEFEGETIGLEEVVVPAGKERQVTWTAPGKAGRYEIVCDLPGHRENGMVMQVEVR